MVKKIIKKIKANTVKKKTAKTTLSNTKRVFKRTSPDELFALTEKEAYYLFEKRGSGHGNDRDDWYKAEKKVQKIIKK